MASGEVLAVSVGEPALGRFVGEGFDLTPLFVAAATLLILKVALGVPMRWQLLLGTVLVAPLLVALADRISYPLTAALVLGGATAVGAVARRYPRRPRAS